MINCLHLRYFIIVFAIVTIASCDNNKELGQEKEKRYLSQYLDSKNIDIEPLSSGLYYISNVEGAGIMPEIDDWVIIQYTAKMINDNVLDTTDEELAIINGLYSTLNLYGARRISLNSIAVKGVQEGLMLMKEGGEGTFIIPSHLAYGNRTSVGIPPYTTLIYDVELIKVIKNPVEYENQMIEDYISMYSDSAHLVVEKRTSGLYYIEISEGTGDSKPEENDDVSVYYHGSLTDGRIFDSNIGGNSYTFTIHGNSAISGFEEGVSLMKKNGTSRILIPSSLGYGTEGSGDKIVGYTPLVFDLELIDIQKH